jgi:hypothetical protein
VYSLPFLQKKLPGLAIGDSITWLNEHANETGKRITKGYMTRVVEKLPYIHYFNQGTMGGHPGILQRISTHSAFKKQIYTLYFLEQMIGGSAADR